MATISSTLLIRDAAGGRDPALLAAYVGFGLVGPVLYLTPLGMALLMPALCLALLLHARRAGSFDLGAILRAFWPVGAFAAFAMISALWAIAPGRALAEGARLGVELAIAATLIVT